MSRFEVQTRMLGGWENCWHEDGEPRYFVTRAAAFDAIEEHQTSMREAGMTCDPLRVMLAPAERPEPALALAPYRRPDPQPPFYSHDAALAALCLWEAMLAASAAGQPDDPLESVWEGVGSTEMRDRCLTMAVPANDLFNRLNAGPEFRLDTLAFDWEFMPMIVDLIDWSTPAWAQPEAEIDALVLARAAPPAPPELEAVDERAAYVARLEAAVLNAEYFIADPDVARNKGWKPAEVFGMATEIREARRASGSTPSAD